MARLIAAALVSMLMAGASGASASRADAPRIVPWHLIGDAGLRMSRAEVERFYGRPYYPGPEAPQYRVRGGVLFVGYGLPCKEGGICRGRVRFVATNSARYRTPNGLGVGTRIPFPRCKQAGCAHTWKGFRLGRDPGTGVPVWWRWATFAGKPVTTYLDVTGKGDAPYEAVGTGVVFQVNLADGRMAASAFGA
jgi:hypothetical protein